MEQRISSQAGDNNMKLALQGRISGSPDAYYNNITGGFHTIDGLDGKYDSIMKQIEDLKAKKFKVAGIELGFGGSTMAIIYYAVPEPYKFVAIGIVGGITALITLVSYYFSPEDKIIKNKEDMLEAYKLAFDKNISLNQHVSLKEHELGREYIESNTNIQKTVLGKVSEKADDNIAVELMNSKHDVIEAAKNLNKDLIGYTPIQNLDVINREVSKTISGIKK